MASNVPVTFSNQSLRRNRTEEIPSAEAFFPASASASADLSMATTSVPGRSAATESAMAPVPVPRSRTRAGVPAGRKVFSFSRTNPTSSSVSGRGMSARGSHLSVSVRKSVSPTMYCTGSRRARRRMRSRKVSTCACVSGRSNCKYKSRRRQCSVPAKISSL